MREPSIHLEETSFQRYLEGDLDREAQAFADSHVATCAVCAARLEEWRMLLTELGDLPALSPSAEFGDRVLETVPTGPVAAHGLWTRLRIGLRRPTTESHPTAGVLQDLVETAGSSRRAARIQSHLRDCGTCRQEYGRWQRLYAALEGLPQFGPSPGFAAAVMLRIEVAANRAIAPSWSADLLSALPFLVPSTRKAWGVASVLVAAPVSVVAALVAAVFLHPLLSPGDLLMFGAWRALDIVQTSTSWVLSAGTDSTLLLGSVRLVQALLSSPGTTVTALVGIWATLFAAGWILYRNVLAPPLIASRHG